MSAFLYRVIIAVICVVLLNAIVDPFLAVAGFNVSVDVLTILKICIAGLAVLYVLKGPPFPA